MQYSLGKNFTQSMLRAGKLDGIKIRFRSRHRFASFSRKTDVHCLHRRGHSARRELSRKNYVLRHTQPRCIKI